MSARITHRKASPLATDDYLELVRIFPVRPIRSKAEHKQATAVLNKLIGRDDLSTGQRDYIAGLARFVEDFESEHVFEHLPQLTPIEILKELLAANNMNTSDLGDVLGSRGLASEVLNGKRGLSKTLIMKLARRFKVDPGLFLFDKSESEN